MASVDIVYRYGPQEVPVRPRPADGDAALARLDAGNRAFAALLDSVRGDGEPARRVVHVDPRDLGLVPGAARVPSQQPFAAILGCADARVPIELIFNEGPNDLFVVRVAGNGLGADALGSLKYAIEHLGGSLRLVVVLGHSGCGAASAAVDVFLNPGDYLPLANDPSLRQILDRLLVVVQASARKLAAVFGPEVVRHPGYREALIESAIVTNAALTAFSVQKAIDADGSDGLRTVYGVYRLETREVWTPRLGRPQGSGLAAAPRDLRGFNELGDAMVQSTRMKAMLAGSHTRP